MSHAWKLSFFAIAVLLSSAQAPLLARSGATEATGSIYGTVETDSGRKYTGLLRWDDEEAYWDDLFNGGKSKLPYIDRMPEEERKHRNISVLGINIDYDWDESEGRQFIARFGDIQEIRPRSGDKVDIVMKGGTKYLLDGGSNDIGATIVVEDEEDGRTEIEWSKIERITFAAAPGSASPEARRLSGDVTTEDGVFHGFVQWDSQECESTDRLDAYSEDGKVSIPMGGIRSIKKESRKRSTLDLKDGRTLSVHGTNDVDSSIRGIFVEDERFGRVKVSWDAFKSVDFAVGSVTGRGYADYKPATPLRGTVTDRDGRSFKGRIIFDLDESESWEILNGEKNGVEYNIPFRMVKSVAPHDSNTSDVTLKGGAELRLGDSQDVTEKNAGILVILDSGGTEQYLSWRNVRRIDFD